MPIPIKSWMGTTPDRLREEIQADTSGYMRLRRAAAVVSLLGIGMMR